MAKKKTKLCCSAPTLDTNRQPVSIIYIAGYGHSGSTILQILLSNASQIVGLGELTHFGPLNPETLFSVDQSEGTDDPRRLFYSNLICELNRKNLALGTFSKLRRVQRVLPLPKESDTMLYIKTWRTFFEIVASGPMPALCLVDSSKTTFGNGRRPLLLNKIPGTKVCFIHLIRDPLPVLWRMEKKAIDKKLRQSRSKSMQVLISAGHWLFSNMWAAMISRRFKKSIRISYEQLCLEPEQTLRQIGEKFSLDLSDVIGSVQRGDALRPSYAFAGNRLMKDKEIRFQPRLKQDYECGKTTWILAKLLRLFYYLLRPKHSALS